MAIGSPQWMYSSGTGEYEIEQSIRLDDTNNSFLHRTPSSGGNRRTYTISTWVKRGRVQNGSIVVSGADNNYVFRFRFNGTALHAYDYHGGSNQFQWVLQSNDQFMDTSAWYHVLLAVDTTQATNTNRIKMYVNGSQITDLGIASYPAQNYQSYINDVEKIWIGETISEDSALDAYLADTYFIDGQALTPSDFGEIGDYAEWKPKKYTGTYGSNGYFLNYSNASSLGADSSGNGNNFTAANLSAHDKMLDTPTNNFAVMNSMRPNCDDAFREGNLYLRNSGSVMGVSTFLPKTGKWYWEVDPQDRYAGSPQYGIATEEINNETEVGSNLDGVKIVAYSGGNDISLHGTGTLHGSTGPWPSDHIWGFALDNDNGKLWISRDGDWTHVLSGGNPSTATNPTASGLPTGYPIFGNIGSDSTTYNAYIRVNFGADGTFFGNQTSGGYSDANGYGDFKYAVPTGFLALCAKNLPDPAVVPQENFAAISYNGNGSVNADITDDIKNFPPDLVWIKSRSSTYHHHLYDYVRGANKGLSANDTGAEDTSTDIMKQFNGNGFRVGGNYQVNDPNATYAAWVWKGSRSTSSNTNGNITSTVSVNTDAGFSIVKWTHDGGSNPRTVGHGLSKAPQFIIMKHLNSTSNWYVMHQDLASTQEIELNNSAGVQNGSDFGSVAPTASVFSTSTTGVSGRQIIAYCWHEVEGYSSFGEFDGNNVNNDGPFIHTGFEPAFLLVKATHGSYSWNIADDRRSPSNPLSEIIYSNETLAEENWTSPPFEFMSNGFKINYNHPSVNGSSGHYIYAAFAKTPQKYSNAR